MTDEEIHELAARDFHSQIKANNGRLMGVIKELAAIYKSGSASTPPPALTEDERAARQIAKNILNGEEIDLFVPPEVDREKLLYREKRGIELAIDILNKKYSDARAAQAVAAAEALKPGWRKLMRERTLTRVRLDALDRQAQEILEQSPDRSAIDLPLMNTVGWQPVGEMALEHLIKPSLEADLVTAAELRKASAALDLER
jgi:hypothetical protein